MNMALDTHRNTFDNELLSYLNELVGGNEQYMLEMLEIIIAELPISIMTIEGKIVEKDWFAVHKEAHKLKSTLRLAGLYELGEVIETVDRLAKLEFNVAHIETIFQEFKINAQEALILIRMEARKLKR